MPMLAECIDAVIGVDTHRDTHHAEIAHPSGAVIAACSIPSTSVGYAQLLAWARGHAPGPRLVISIEGTRSYGAGLARAATAAGLMVTECEQPTRKTRRGKGKSDPIDAHLAVQASVISCRATSKIRRASRSPSARGTGSRLASSRSAVSTARCASIGSDLPLPRRCLRLGCSHSSTSRPATASARASPIP